MNIGATWDVDECQACLVHPDGAVRCRPDGDLPCHYRDTHDYVWVEVSRPGGNLNLPLWICLKMHFVCVQVSAPVEPLAPGTSLLLRPPWPGSQGSSGGRPFRHLVLPGASQ